MFFKFLHPYYLLLIPIAIIFIIGSQKGKKYFSSFSKKLYITIRSMVFICIVLALSGISIYVASDAAATIFAVDLSASVKVLAPDMVNFISQSLAAKTDKDYTGIIVFGGNAVIEKNSSSNMEIDAIDAIVDQSSTNIAEGLKMAKTLIPAHAMKKIVLISDGLETEGSALLEAKLLKEENITVDVHTLSESLQYEVQFTHLKTPKTMNKNAKYEIEATIHSLKDTKAEIKIYCQNRFVASNQVNLSAGENKFVFSDIAAEEGEIIYRGEVYPLEDTYVENNQFFSYSFVAGLPNVLIVEYNGSGAEMEKLLRATGINVTTMQAVAVPTDLTQLKNYAAIIICDVPIDDMPEDFPKVLESYVKTIGGGLLATGGENAFAPGGYFNTPLETVLPVEMELKTQEDSPNLGMVIVLDRSGSMVDSQYGISKLELSKEAAISSLESLKEGDYLGVIAFDTLAEWAVPFAKIAGNQNELESSIAKISPGGGTSILPGLNEAYTALENANCQLKHIILLTDGQAERTGYASLTAAMNARGITLSTVAVGRDADRELLEQLAEDGLGRYYYTNEFSDLPKIFIKETFLAGKTYLNNETFFPKAVSYSAVLDGITALPSIDGYVSTTAKARANVTLASPNGEPVLSFWQYGLGRAAAFSSDVFGGWTADFMAAEEGQLLLRNTVSYILKTGTSKDVAAWGDIVGKDVEINVEIPNYSGIAHVTGKAVSSSLEEFDLDFESISPGAFTAALPNASRGGYIVNLDVTQLDGSTYVISTGVNIPYAKEYDIVNVKQGADLLRNIAQITGGHLLDNPASALVHDAEKAYAQTNISFIFLLSAIILFIADVFFRRFPTVVLAVEIRFLKIKERLCRWQLSGKTEVSYHRKKMREKEETGIKKSTVKAAENIVDLHAGTKNKANVTNTTSRLLSQKKKRTR